MLYDTNSIVEMYETNEFNEYAPGYFSIGNDNGDYELLMKAELEATQCGFLEAGSIGSLEPDEWFDFEKWLENGCENQSDNGEIMSKACSVHDVQGYQIFESC